MRPFVYEQSVKRSKQTNPKLTYILLLHDGKAKQQQDDEDELIDYQRESSHGKTVSF